MLSYDVSLIPFMVDLLIDKCVSVVLDNSSLCIKEIRSVKALIDDLMRDFI